MISSGCCTWHDRYVLHSLYNTKCLRCLHYLYVLWCWLYLFLNTSLLLSLHIVYSISYTFHAQWFRFSFFGIWKLRYPIAASVFFRTIVTVNVISSKTFNGIWSCYRSNLLVDDRVVEVEWTKICAIEVAGFSNPFMASAFWINSTKEECWERGFRV